MSEDWDHLVCQYEAADQAAHAAYLASDCADGPSEREQLDQRYDALRHIAREHEDRLYATDPPNLSAALYQLKAFVLRFNCVDLDDAPAPGEDEEARVLRRIYANLRRHAAAI